MTEEQRQKKRRRDRESKRRTRARARGVPVNPNPRRDRPVLRAGSDMPDLSAGLCVGEDPDLWFSEELEDTEFAKLLCRVCPVRADCLVFADLNREQFGIWGGEDETERRARWRRQAA
jgi:WhiB family transcriptional regulator, redox-sensing transcriptional regulator